MIGVPLQEIKHKHETIVIIAVILINFILFSFKYIDFSTNLLLKKIFIGVSEIKTFKLTLSLF